MIETAIDISLGMIEHRIHKCHRESINRHARKTMHFFQSAQEQQVKNANDAEIWKWWSIITTYTQQQAFLGSTQLVRVFPNMQQRNVSAFFSICSSQSTQNNQIPMTRGMFATKHQLPVLPPHPTPLENILRV